MAHNTRAVSPSPSHPRSLAASTTLSSLPPTHHSLSDSPHHHLLSLARRFNGQQHQQTSFPTPDPMGNINKRCFFVPHVSPPNQRKKRHPGAPLGNKLPQSMSGIPAQRGPTVARIPMHALNLGPALCGAFGGSQQAPTLGANGPAVEMCM